ncbi:MAG: phenylalanine--tRNA ligase subunit beta, partial [Butyricicoccaceae bacterium]
PKRLPLECDKMNKLLGLSLSDEAQIEILERLGFTVENGEVVVPYYRIDIERMCDLAEEVARIYGYDRIPTTLYAGESVLGALTAKQQFERTLGLYARTCGFDESISYSFGSPKMYDQIGLPEDSAQRISVTILNPLGEDFSVLRTTALPTLLDNLSHNFNHRNPTASLYEIATIYTPVVKDGKADPDVLPHEEHVLTLGTYGRMNFFQFKGAIETILNRSDVRDISFEPVKDNPSYHPGRCAKVLSGDTVIGIFGTIHPVIAKKAGIDQEILSAELYVDAMFANVDSTKQYVPLPKFPASTRDIAVLCDEDIPVASMEKAIKAAVGGILESVSLFDVYRGDKLPSGKKSVAYSLKLRHAERTLTDAECIDAMNKALKALGDKFGAVLRG